MTDYWKKYHDEIYKLDQKPYYDNSTANRSYLSVGVDDNVTLDNNSLIKFTVWPSDVCILPWDSYLLIEGQVTKADGTTYAKADTPDIAFCNNGALFLFETARYLIDDVEIESFTNVGIATSFMGLIKKSSAFSGLEKSWCTDINDGDAVLENAGYSERNKFLIDRYASTPDAQTGTFSFRIPLDFIFNFCDDYRKVIYHHKHQIIFQRKSNDDMALMKRAGVDSGKVNLTRMMWRVRKYTPSNEELENIYKYTKEDIMLYFRNKYIVSGIVTGGSTSFPVNITYSGGFGTPRYIIVAFQVKLAAVTDQSMNYGIFNYPNKAIATQINVGYTRISINNDVQLNNDIISDFTKNRGVEWYNELKNLRADYTGMTDDEICISYVNFARLYRMYVFDISKQNISAKSGLVNVKIDFNFVTAIPAPDVGITRYYAMSIYDKEYVINSITQQVVGIN